MGWSLGEDSEGRAIGYSVEAECDGEGCKTMIDRGDIYACGGVHGDRPPDEHGEGGSCEGYYCEACCYSHTAFRCEGEACPFVVEMNKPIEYVNDDATPVAVLSCQRGHDWTRATHERHGSTDHEDATA